MAVSFCQGDGDGTATAGERWCESKGMLSESDDGDIELYST